MSPPSICKRRPKGRSGRPLPVVRLLRSRNERLALTSWECKNADRGKTTLLSVRATPCGFQPQRWAAPAGRSSGSTPASATMHGRSFQSATRPDLWSRAGSVVTFSTFVFYMHRRHTLHGPRSGGTTPDRSFQADSQQSRHDRCQRTTGRGSHLLAGEHLQTGL